VKGKNGGLQIPKKKPTKRGGEGLRVPWRKDDCSNSRREKSFLRKVNDSLGGEGEEKPGKNWADFKREKKRGRSGLRKRGEQFCSCPDEKKPYVVTQKEAISKKGGPTCQGAWGPLARMEGGDGLTLR